MTTEEITKYLNELNEELLRADINGEVSLFGGAVMCLAFKTRPATKDVDAIFQPTAEIRKAIKLIAERHQLPEDWLNDGVKGYVVNHKTKVLFDLSNLQVLIPETDYLLAMKALAARGDTFDKEDVRVLIDSLNLTTPDEVFDILEKYYPNELIKPSTQYFIEGIFEK